MDYTMLSGHRPYRILARHSGLLFIQKALSKPKAFCGAAFAVLLRSSHGYLYIHRLAVMGAITCSIIDTNTTTQTTRVTSAAVFSLEFP
jgi:hypothetical protein